MRGAHTRTQRKEGQTEKGEEHTHTHTLATYAEEGQTDRQTDRQADRQTDRQTNRQAGRQAGRQQTDGPGPTRPDSEK